MGIRGTEGWLGFIEKESSTSSSLLFIFSNHLGKLVFPFGSELLIFLLLMGKLVPMHSNNRLYINLQVFILNRKWVLDFQV